MQIYKLSHYSQREIMQLVHSKLLLSVVKANVLEGQEIRQSILLTFK